MKKIIAILISILFFNAGILHADGTEHKDKAPESAKTEHTIDVQKLSPVAPAVAEFNDGAWLTSSPLGSANKLVPSTPREADFEDPGRLNPINVEKIAPSPPMETDFEDADIVPFRIIQALLPVTPAEADFTR